MTPAEEAIRFRIAYPSQAVLPNPFDPRTSHNDLLNFPSLSSIRSVANMALDQAAAATNAKRANPSDPLTDQLRTAILEAAERQRYG